MRRGADTATWTLVLVLGFAVAATAQEAPRPNGAEDEDVAAALAELDELDQPPSAADLAALMDGTPASGRGRSWEGTVAVRWRRDRDGGLARDAAVAAGGADWSLRLRARAAAGAPPAAAGTGAVAWGPLRLRAGGWTWSSPYGLLAGAAGRSATFAADGGLVAGEGGGRGWTGRPDDRAAGGAIVGLDLGPVAVHAGGGSTAAGRSRRLLAVGGRGGAWQLAAVRDGDTPPALGMSGRWRRGAWRGAWELAGRAAGRRPAVAAAVAWQAGRTAVAEALVVAVPREAAGTGAASQPLLGTGPGWSRALRLRWRPGGGVRLAALAAAAHRDGDGRADPDDRLVGDLLAGAALPGGVALEARLRTSGRTRSVWSEAWPWAPPAREPGRHTRTTSVAASGTAGRTSWRLRLASVAVAHSATEGRRTLVTASLRGGAEDGASWQAAWRTAWGDPVDLATAVCPLPGVLVPRHWGRWDQGWFARVGLALGPGRLDAAVDLRGNSAGERSLEVWIGGSGCW